MRTDDWKRVADRPNWREADLHDLRTRYAALLADIAAHREAMWHKTTTPADDRLWAVLDKEGFGA